MSDLDRIRSALAGHRPELEGEAERRAAVALVLRDAAAGPEALFIERAKHEGDPWSGHMAFPGGRVDPGDPDSRAAAERETREEVGVDLAAAQLLGRLDDLQGRHAGRRTGLVVSAFVYHHAAPGELALNHEVQTALWVPVQTLVDPVHRVELRPAADAPAYPGIRVSETEAHVVWGLTYRFLEIFLERVGRPIPDRWQGVFGAVASPKGAQ